MINTIEYSSNFNNNNKDIVIFVSNISQLKNIDFPSNFIQYSKNKNFLNELRANKIIHINNFLNNKNLLLNVSICLLPKNINECLNIGSSIYSYKSKRKINNITFIFSQNLIVKNKTSISNVVLGFCIKSYNFDNYKEDTKNKIILRLHKIKIFKELKYNINLLKSINFTKELVSEPANVLNPISYANKCLELKKLGIKVKILDQTQLEKIGMHSLLGVANGSAIEPRVVIFEWKLNKKMKPTILAGKGVTFDTGGISLKPASGMEEMITDMGGSAVVVGSMMNAALNNYSQPLLGIIGLVENMPDGKSQRPGDIVKSLSGQTIEVLNTDAEGRLVLADILTYTQNKYKPKQIIDFATLTGAIMIALGTHRAGLFSNNDSLSTKLMNSGETTGERLWRLPLGQEYDDEINSSRADMQNIGSTRFGGSIQAAQFIQRFVKNNIPWAHLDIAGVTWTKKAGLNTFSKLHSSGATAFGIRLIDHFLKGK